jgi:hypothetical protein
VSAKSRAIVLETTQDTLLVRATPAEVREHTLGQAVELLRDTGWRPQEYQRASRMPMDYGLVVVRSGSIEARLVTKCGCEKWLMVPWPPTTSYRVPVRRGPMSTAANNEADLGMVSMEVRTFRMQHMKQRPDGRPFAEYEEE